jgi:hypothetical protein
VPYTAYSQSSNLKSSSGNKRKTFIVIVAIVIVAIVILAAVIIFFIPDGGKITDIYVGLSESHSDYLDVTVLVGSSSRASIAGDGDLEITYNDNVIYTSKISINDDGTGELNLPYNDFIEGNGDYFFQCKYKGKESPPATYHVGYIVENLHTDVDVGVVLDSGSLDITTFMQTKEGTSVSSDPKDAEYQVTEIRNMDDGSEIQVENTPVDIGGSFIQMEYPYQQSGNYSISIRVENTRAKTTSEFYEVNMTREVFLNILPQARAVVSTTEAMGATYNASFDTSSSWNDGEITLYIWDFNGDGNVDLETTEPIASYSGYIDGMDYDAILNVQGDVLVDPIFNTLERGAAIIPVSSP